LATCPNDLPSLPRENFLSFLKFRVFLGYINRTSFLLSRQSRRIHICALMFVIVLQ
jgi:hypothetical protein